MRPQRVDLTVLVPVCTVFSHALEVRNHFLSLILSCVLCPFVCSQVIAGWICALSVSAVLCLIVFSIIARQVEPGTGGAYVAIAFEGVAATLLTLGFTMEVGFAENVSRLEPRPRTRSPVHSSISV